MTDDWDTYESELIEAAEAMDTQRRRRGRAAEQLVTENYPSVEIDQARENKDGGLVVTGRYGNGRAFAATFTPTEWRRALAKEFPEPDERQVIGGD